MFCYLTTVREINRAVLVNINGGNNGVYALVGFGGARRINRARTVKGQLQVHSLQDDRWIVPVSVYQA